MINIRKADIDDVITISKLGRITFSDTFESFFNDKNDLLDYLEDIFSEKRIHDSILKAESIYWIAFYDSIPIGYAKVKLDFTSQLIQPKNGWSLKGLSLAYSGLGDLSGKKETESRFNDAWVNSDIEIKSSVVK